MTRARTSMTCFAAFGTALLAGCVAPRATQVASRNLFKNPSFEQLDEKRKPAGWILAAEDGLAWAADTTQKHSGGSSVKVTGAGVKPKFVGLRHGHPLRLERNRVYELSAWVKAENASFTTGGEGGNVLWFHRYVGKTQRIGDWPLHVPPGTYDWTRFSTRLTTKAPITLAPVGPSVDWHPIGYLGLQEDDRIVSEPWPDILLPSGPFTAREGELQPIWVTVYAGPDTPSGDYETSVRIQASNSTDPVTATINVHVYDFALPKSSSLPTSFRASLPCTRDLLWSHRLMPGLLAAHVEGFHDHEANYKKGFTEFEQVRPIIEERLKDYLARGGSIFPVGQTYFRGCFAGGTHSIGAHGGFNLRYSGAIREYVLRYHREFAQFLREKGVFEKAFVYLWDEPAPSVYANVNAVRELVREAAPEFRCLVPGVFADEIYDAVDIWVPHLNDWAEHRDVAARAKADGKDVWWYTTSGPALPYPSFSRIDPDHDLIGARLTFWMVWQYRIDGFLYWTTDWWRGSTEKSPWFGTLRRVGNTTDCWWSKGTGVYPAGDGFLTYPVPGLESDDKTKALSTIRLEAIRDGLEEYEYFLLLRQLVDTVKVSGVADEAVAAAESLLDIPAQIFESPTEWRGDDALMRAHRDRVARAVEQLASAAE